LTSTQIRSRSSGRVASRTSSSSSRCAFSNTLESAVGAAAWVAQKILKDPFGQMFAFEYAITGSWSDPKVEKLQQPVASKKEEANQ
jgi:uncharacterized protein YhdP